MLVISLKISSPEAVGANLTWKGGTCGVSKQNTNNRVALNIRVQENVNYPILDLYTNGIARSTGLDKGVVVRLLTFLWSINQNTNIVLIGKDVLKQGKQYKVQIQPSLTWSSIAYAP